MKNNVTMSSCLLSITLPWDIRRLASLQRTTAFLRWQQVQSRKRVELSFENVIKKSGYSDHRVQSLIIARLLMPKVNNINRLEWRNESTCPIRRWQDTGGQVVEKSADKTHVVLQPKYQLRVNLRSLRAAWTNISRRISNYRCITGCLYLVDGITTHSCV